MCTSNDKIFNFVMTCLGISMVTLTIVMSVLMILKAYYKGF